MDFELEVDARLAVLEDMVAETFARIVGDEQTVRDWSNRVSDIVDREAVRRETADPETVTTYTAAWDAMLANVRRVHAALRADGHGGDPPAG